MSDVQRSPTKLTAPLHSLHHWAIAPLCWLSPPSPPGTNVYRKISPEDRTGSGSTPVIPVKKKPVHPPAGTPGAGYCSYGSHTSASARSLKRVAPREGVDRKHRTQSDVSAARVWRGIGGGEGGETFTTPSLGATLQTKAAISD